MFVFRGQGKKKMPKINKKSPIDNICYEPLTEDNFDPTKFYPCHGPSLTKEQLAYYKAYYDKLCKDKKLKKVRK